MTLNDFEALEEELWTDVEETADAPQHRPLLAHYTSAANFELIVRNEELWLSHPFYMNDHEELRWGVEHGAPRWR